jgi:hypothetical protein
MVQSYYRWVVIKNYSILAIENYGGNTNKYFRRYSLVVGSTHDYSAMMGHNTYMSSSD